MEYGKEEEIMTDRLETNNMRRDECEEHRKVFYSFKRLMNQYSATKRKGIERIRNDWTMNDRTMREMREEEEKTN